MNKTTIASKIGEPASSSLPEPEKSPSLWSHVLPSLVFMESRKMPDMAMKTIIMNAIFQPPCRYIGSPSLWNEPTSSRKRILKNNTITAFATVSLIICTSSFAAMTKNAITNEAIALRFFFVYFLPSISSVPSTFVFSSIAKTIVKTSRKGITTSYKPISSKKSITCLKGVAMSFQGLYWYLNFSENFINKTSTLMRMLDKSEFNKIREEMHSLDLKREEIIQTSREVISISKQIIYAAQRNDLNEAEASIKKIKDKIKKLRKVNISTDTNINSVAFQEYVEAIAFYEFVKHKKEPTRASLGVSADYYLSGLCDLTGELVRKAIYDVIHKKFDEAARIKELVHDIYGEFLKLHLRNGELRKKSDSIKWNLKKLEEVMYDISMKGRH